MAKIGPSRLRSLEFCLMPITRSPAQNLHIRTLVAMAKTGPSRPRPLMFRFLTAPVRAYFF
ncbi:hypothetical protein BVG98_15020 [Lacticaseibacillus rhamnosus]|nr:hypothetical protein BVG98_15020 [Lacticaseibacillus rhamnosus]